MQTHYCFNVFFIVGIFHLSIIFPSKAQDAHFSQFFSTPLYVNPAMAGTTPQGRFTFNYRAQWPQLPGEFVTYQVAYDQSFEDYNSSIGLWANFDKAGSAGIQSSQVHFIYAYNLQLAAELGLRAGLQIGYGNRTLDYFKLIFGDQLSEIGYTGSPSAELGLQNANLHYFDVASGLMLYGEKFWFGFSAHHLNTPNHSITEIPEQLPMKISIQGGFKITKYQAGKSLREGYTMAVIPGFLFSQQGNYRQLDVGANGFINPLIVGLWYRGVPIQKSYNGALVTTVGFKHKDLSFLYSYDVALGQFATITGGAHEFSLSVKIGDKETKKKYKRKGGLLNFPSWIY